MDIYQFLWAKTNKNEAWHPLIYHMIDAGNVALTLWHQYLPYSSRNRFSQRLNLSEEDSGRLLAFWASLHDMGKASPAFQAKSQKLKIELIGRGIPFPTNLSPKPHNLITTWALQSLLSPQLKPVGRILSGHHGRLANGHEILDPARFEQLGREPIWQDMRSQLFNVLKEAFFPPDINSLPDEPADRNSLLLLLLGLVVAADWVASDESRFEFTPPGISVEEYGYMSKEHAKLAVHDLGFSGWNATGKTISFASMFHHRDIREPNIIQQTVINFATTIPSPSLVILEAPTGTGKTEAALYLADCWLQSSLGRGIYVAMPTTATSDQMFDRTRNYLENRYPDSLVNLQLIHGQALLDDRYMALQLAQIGEEEEGRVAAMQWFTSSKKALLAPFGVGTVDQSFLAVLQSRFFFLRLFGLEGKVVIFDEVHAYDTYMSELFLRLLNWLHMVGTSVIILSATLPDSTRRKLIDAYSTTPSTITEEIPPYPRLTVWSHNVQDVYPLPIPDEVMRSINLNWLDSSPSAIVQFLQEKLSAGGCAAVICNTVKRAQEVYLAIKEANIVPLDECHLFHARYPYSWRKDIEEKILARFSRVGQRPHKSIVIATQVIEQSLDLDFDILVSALAPVDLLIQRAGRLHRHKRENRPVLLSQPILAVTSPVQDRGGKPDFGPDGHVYAPYILDRTFLILRTRTKLNMPQDTCGLIEGVYNNEAIPTATTEENERVSAERRDHEMQEARNVHDARTRLILPAEDDTFFFDGTIGLEEDQPDLYTSYQALTRADPPGLMLVCLHRAQDGQLHFDPNEVNITISLDEPPDRQQIKRMLMCAVQINRKDVMNWFIAQPVPPAWKKVAALRHARAAIFIDGVCQLTGTPLFLQLDREIGLRVEKEVR